MTPLIKSKLTAFLIHLGISTLILSTFLAIVYFIWYPEAFFEIEGGWPVVAVLIAVDIIIGPLLTFIVFNPEKKELYFDLSVIAFVQIAAFIYGSMTIFQERPLYVAFYEDRFSLISAASINIDELKDKALLNGFFSPPRFVYVQIPATSKERKELIHKLESGKDINHFPEYYYPYQENLSHILQNQYRLDLNFILNNYPEQKAVITEMAQGLAIESLIYFPLQGSVKKQVIVLKPDDGSMLGILKVDPLI